MSDRLTLPDAPSLEWLRKEAKRRLTELRAADPDAQLADAQLDLARRHGFTSWRALKAHVDALTVDGHAAHLRARRAHATHDRIERPHRGVDRRPTHVRGD